MPQCCLGMSAKRNPVLRAEILRLCAGARWVMKIDGAKEWTISLCVDTEWVMKIDGAKEWTISLCTGTKGIMQK